MNKDVFEGKKVEQRAVHFCPYCGTRLDSGANFCKNCGAPTIIHNPSSDESSQQTSQVRPKQRETFYEGYIHKCPSCGEVLESFITNCPACGYEIRDSKTTDSVREFAEKLAQIEARKMPVYEEKKSVMKIFFGRDLKETDEVEKAEKQFIEQKDQEKANLILNYSLPNTKEDILEFILLASSNIDTSHSLKNIVTAAWISKLEQVYQKAVISIENEDDFAQIEEIYIKKQQQIRANKLFEAFKFLGLLALWFILMGMLWNPLVTFLIAIPIGVLLAVFSVLYIKKK